MPRFLAIFLEVIYNQTQDLYCEENYFSICHYSFLLATLPVTPLLFSAYIYAEMLKIEKGSYTFKHHCIFYLILYPEISILSSAVLENTVLSTNEVNFSRQSGQFQYISWEHNTDSCIFLQAPQIFVCDINRFFKQLI